MAKHQLTATVLLAVLLALAAPSLARDPDMLQDICVADYSSLDGPLRVNGYPCKRISNVTAEDFFYGGLATAADVYAGGNPMGSVVTPAGADKLPGLNTEMLLVLQGALEVGFVLPGTANRLITRTVPTGGAFVFPRGTVHYERSVGESPAVAVSAFDSQSPGTVVVGDALFGAAPAVPTEVLARAFLVDVGVVEKIKSKFQTN
ncbi:germin-like protein 1-4 isoform X2 [Brachypodium distachyon]|uniref:germin-like protein 1-4 isoform X2 n=1 Tax=Brachypodium distachyon TaxID=15368 RepID=UPI00071C2ED3|nr:germin-like protein 1-4 isoform X2 [Brachypodium distachyon]|eukprot:XP_014754820.1 germin-like protein 1-4 isoform X2 [Brachypodium distachyon]